MATEQEKLIETLRAAGYRVVATGGNVVFKLLSQTTPMTRQTTSSWTVFSPDGEKVCTLHHETPATEWKPVPNIVGQTATPAAAYHPDGIPDGIQPTSNP